jgi:hypothetical protein
MLCLAWHDIESRPQCCLSRDGAATPACKRGTYLIELTAGLVRPIRATVSSRRALCAARDSGSTDDEKADAQQRQHQHPM